MSNLYAGLEPDEIPAQHELTLEPVRCVWPGCEELTFPDRRARSDHALEMHAIAALAMIQMPNPDLFKPKPKPEPVDELPIEWGDE